jgi:RNA recognition motif-containing protein
MAERAAVEAAAAAARRPEMEGKDGKLSRGTKRSRDGEDGARPQKKGRTEESAVAKEAFTLFVRNIAFGVKEDDIHDLFAKVGNVIAVRLVRDRGGKSKGYAYVDFADKVVLQ